MATITDYLKKLLFQYDCVVVPELGAFLTHYQSASFSESTGLFLPPRKRVAFNEALRLDDGILANYIMLHEPVSREGAQRLISQFVQSLRQDLEQNDHIELDGIGRFSRNSEGRLQFEPGLRHNFFGEAYGMSAISAQLVQRKALTEPVLDAVPVAPATALGPVRVPDEHETVLTPLRRSAPYWRIAASLLLIGSLGAVSYFTVVEPNGPLRSGLDPASLFRLPAFLTDKLARPALKPVSAPAVSETKTPAVASAKPVAALAASPAPAANSTPITPAATALVAPKPVATSEAVVAAAPTRAVEVAPVSRPAVNRPAEARRSIAQPVRALVKTPKVIPYTIIAGSFASKRNALRLRRQLRTAGYTDAYVIMPATAKQLYKVAAAGFDDRIEAINSVTPISELAGTPAWIYKQ
ncbi:SPOR domain-containing protein [Spirosoma luteolum]